MTLATSYLTNSRCTKDTQTLLCPRESRKYICHTKHPLRVLRTKKTPLVTRNEDVQVKKAIETTLNFCI